MADDETSVRENPDENRFELWVGGELAGEIAYERRGEAYLLVHTEVGDRFSGRGLAGQLVRAALDDLAGRGAEVLPYCSYVRSFVARHREYVPLVPAERRARFGLADGEEIRSGGS